MASAQRVLAPASRNEGKALLPGAAGPVWIGYRARHCVPRWRRWRRPPPPPPYPPPKVPFNVLTPTHPPASASARSIIETRGLTSGTRTQSGKRERRRGHRRNLRPLCPRRHEVPVLMTGRRSIRVLHCDRELVVVDKPASVPVRRFSPTHHPPSRHRIFVFDVVSLPPASQPSSGGRHDHWCIGVCNL